MDSAANSKTADADSLQRLLSLLVRRARRSRAYAILLVIPYNLGWTAIIGVLVVVFFAGVIPPGAHNTFLFWYIVLQLSSPLLLGIVMRVNSYVKFSRKIAAAAANFPRDIVWVYKGVRSGVFKNKFCIFLCLIDGDSFEFKCSDDETDTVISRFQSLYPEVSRGWDESAEARFKCDPPELRRMLVYTDKIRTISIILTLPARSMK